VPLHKIKSCDGIFNGGVTDVGSTRLDSPPKVLFDPTKSGLGYVSHESGFIGREGTYKSRSARLYGAPAGCRNTIAVSTFRK
jgi:hypothetical protein